MDMGGRKGAATAAGFIDTAGYLGGTLSGFAVGRLAEIGGWASVFNVMAALAAGVGAIAVGYCVEHRRRARLLARSAAASVRSHVDMRKHDLTDRILRIAARGRRSRLLFGEP